jgi:hypothetical protein
MTTISRNEHATAQHQQLAILIGHGEVGVRLMKVLANVSLDGAGSVPSTEVVGSMLYYST